MPQRYSSFSEKERIVDPMKAKSHGAKMSELSKHQSKKKVAELGNDLNFYQAYRNEPVPPDPFITSAVKLVPAIAPPPSAVPCGLDLGKPLKSQNPPVPITNFFKSRDIKKKEATIPSFRGLSDTLAHDFAVEAKKVETKRNENQSQFTSGDNRNVCSTSRDKNNARSYNTHNEPDKDDWDTEYESRATTKKAEAESEKIPLGRNPVSDTNRGTMQGKTDQVPVAQVVSYTPKGSDKGDKILQGELKSLIPTTMEDYGGDAMALKGPELFVQMCCEERPLVEVTVVSAFNSRNFVIRAADIDLNEELKKLESRMYQWFTEHFVSDLRIKKNRVYVMQVPDKKVCMRVQVLYKFNDGTAMVSLLDHGREEQVNTRNLVPLKSEWKLLPQLSCHAKCIVELTPEQEVAEDMAFKKKFESNLLTVKPLRGSVVRAEYFNSSGVQFSCFIKCCEVEFYSPADILDLGLDLECLDTGLSIKELEQLRLDIEKWTCEGQLEIQNERRMQSESSNRSQYDYSDQDADDEDEKFFRDCLEDDDNYDSHALTQTSTKNQQTSVCDSDGEDWSW